MKGRGNRREEITKYKETFEVEGYLGYLDYDDGFTSAYISPNFSNCIVYIHDFLSQIKLFYEKKLYLSEIS